LFIIITTDFLLIFICVFYPLSCGLFIHSILSTVSINGAAASVEGDCYGLGIGRCNGTSHCSLQITQQGFDWFMAQGNRQFNHLLS